MLDLFVVLYLYDDMCVLLTTREATWFIISVDFVCLVCLYVCMYVSFERFDARSSYLHIRCISSANTGQVRI